jgi:uncharacterized protein (DUF2147 family)
MKGLLAMAIVLLASSTAQAQYQFEYGGRIIRIDPDHGTVSIPGVYDNTGRRSKRAKGESKSDSKNETKTSDQDASRSKPAPQDAKAEPQATPPPPAPAPAAGPADTAAAPPLASPAAPPAAPPPAATATTTQAPAATANTAALPPPPAPPPGPLPPAPQQDAARQPAPPPAPAVAAAPAQVAAPVQRPRDPNSPLGVWLTEEKEGKVRIEQCGANLCGYSVDAKSNANGEQVLINMKPGKDLKWSGRILDPNTGSTYDSTIAMKGPDTLRVQGCAFGGMFCGGQTWSRID